VSGSAALVAPPGIMSTQRATASKRKPEGEQAASKLGFINKKLGPLYRKAPKQLTQQQQKRTVDRARINVKRVVKTAKSTYKASLERYLEATNEKGVNESDHQSGWLKLIMLAKYTIVTSTSAQVREWTRMRNTSAQRQYNACKRIKRAWRKYNLVKYLHIIAFIKVRSSIGWRLLLWMRITRKRMASKKIYDALLACKNASRGAMCLPIFRQARYKLIKAQRMTRGYLLCKHARLLLLTKKWDRIEKEEESERHADASEKFNEKMKSASHDLVGRGGVLDGVSNLDKRLTEMGQKQNKFESAKQEELYHKIRSSSRRIQNYGAKEAKHEVLCFVLQNARARFAMDAREAIGNVVKRSEKLRAEAMDAKRKGVVSKNEIESMRSMLRMDELTDRHKIGEYMLDFKMGNKGRKPTSNQTPQFLMLKYM
jgi:hypothetical protein